MAGCCHGQPWRWGVTYGPEHVDAGFAEHLEGVRLFPIQAVESGFALLIVVTGIVAIIEGYPLGTAFTFYVLVYAAGRFSFEFFRGDSTRPYLWGFSEAQWISLSIVTADVWAEHAGLVPSYGWHAAVPLLMLTAMLALGLKRRAEWPSGFDLLHPRHIRELAEAVQLLNGALNPLQFSMSLPPQSGSNVIHVANTSLGIRISVGELTHGSHLVRHYSLSQDAAPLSASSARLLATTIAHLHHPSCSFELVSGESGVFHVMFGPDRARSTSRVRSGNRTRVPQSRTSVRAEGLRGW
jgi:Prolipoprotein diacylglyceryl transferase